MEILIVDRHGEIDALDGQKARLNRLTQSLVHFFVDCKQDDRYADTVRSKGRYYPVLVTLTYAPDQSWDSKDISKVIDGYRKHWERSFKLPREDFRYIWVAELQKRGEIHYHIAMWCPRGKSYPFADTYFHKGRTRIEGVKKGVFTYLKKYLSKGCTEGTDATLPRGTRIFGMGGLPAKSRINLAWKRVPEYVRMLCESEFDDNDKDTLPRREKGGWTYRSRTLGKVSIVSNWCVFPVLKTETKDYPMMIAWHPKWFLIDDKECTWSVLDKEKKK